MAGAGINRASAAGARAWLAAFSLALAGCGGLLSWQPAPAPPDRGGYAIVKPGDTLYSIAFRNNLDYHDVAAWNGIGPDYTIYPGQRLRLTPPLAAARAPPRQSSRAAQTPMPPAETSAGTIASAGAAAAWRWPTPGKVVRRFDPADGSKGIDIEGRLGQTVVAAAAGKVVYSGSALKGYGQLIIVKHNERFLSAYGYNRRRLVVEGDWVRAGQPIAELGEGPQQRPELHFEIRDKGVPVDPLRLLPAR